jgi:hypothetical protein
MVFRGMGYISVSSVTAVGGSAFTAGHFRKAGMPAQPKVTNQRVLAPTPDTSVMLGVPKIKIKNQSQNEQGLSDLWGKARSWKPNSVRNVGGTVRRFD